MNALKEHKHPAWIGVLLLISSWVAFTAASCGKQSKDLASNPNKSALSQSGTLDQQRSESNRAEANQPGVSPESGIVGATLTEPGILDETSLQDMISGEAIAASFESRQLTLALFGYMGRNNKLPAQLSELSSLMPFRDLAGEFQLIAGTGNEGQPVLLLERSLQGIHDGFLAVAKNQEITPAGFEGYRPRIGIHAGMQRVVLWSQSSNDGIPSVQPALFEQFSSRLNLPELFPEVGENSDEIARRNQLRSSPPLAVTGSWEWGLFVAMVEDSLWNGALFLNPASGEWELPNSLEELAGAYGGFNSQAWRNPYSGGAAKQVPLKEPTPGNYSITTENDRMIIYFHYMDEEGQVSSRRVS